MDGLLAPNETFRVGLRFERKDARTLRETARRAELKELGAEAAGLFYSAADAAEKDEPLILECESLTEARLVAAGFIQYGVTQPTLEQRA